MKVYGNIVRGILFPIICLVVSGCGDKKLPTPKSSSKPEILSSNAAQDNPRKSIPIVQVSQSIEPSSAELKESEPPKQDAEQIMLILDSSGSMWGQIDGEPKRIIAQTALSTMIPKLSREVELGLVAYGHRRKGDCGDIELLQPPRKNSENAILEKVKTLKAIGKTPLSAAVERAADALSLQDAKTTIILITDGVETCGADPCALGKKLEANGIDFTAHVIGFGLTGNEGRQVSCLADETGGLFIEAQNAGELNDALGTVNDDIALETSSDVLGPATVTVGDKDIIAGSKFEAAWTGPKNTLDSLQVRSVDGAVKYSRTYIYSDEDNSPSAVRAPETAGTYILHYETRSGASLAFDEFAVVAATASVSAPDGEVVGNTRIEVTYTGPENEFDIIVIIDPNDPNQYLSRAYVTHDEEKRVRLSAPTNPGEYMVEYQTRDRKALATDSFTVVSPAAWIKAPDSPIIAGAKFQTEVSANAGDSDRLIILNPDNPRKPFDKGFITHAKNGVLTLMGPQNTGSYTLQYLTKEGEVLAEGTLSIVPPDPELSLENSRLTISERFNITLSGKHGEFDQVVVSNIGDAGKPLFKRYISQSKNGVLTLAAPKEAGNYSVQYRDREGNILNERPVSVIVSIP